jgi:putative SOS response-associated peptidase YedK
MRAKHLRRRPHQTSFTQRDKRYSARDQGELIKQSRGVSFPPWARNDKLQYPTFNARAEDFRTKPSFRDA